MHAGHISPRHPPAPDLCHIPAARWSPHGGRRVLVADTSGADQSALQPTRPTFDLPRPRSARSDRALLESSPDPTAGRHPHAGDPTPVPSGAGAAHIPPALFFILSAPTRPPRSRSGTHRSHRRNEARNPRFGCPRIAQHISRAFGIEIPSPIIMSVHESLWNRHTGCGKAPLTTPNLTWKRTAPLWLRCSYLHGMFDSLPWSYPDATLTTSRRARMEDSHKETGRLGPPNSESDSWKNMPILWRGHLSTRCENRKPIR